MTKRELAKFSGKYDKGRSIAIQALWHITHHLVFKKWWLPTRLRPVILRAFGGTVGTGVLIRHGVLVMWPWKLKIGDDCWIGENAWFINVEDIEVGNNVCISQAAIICSGSHDFRTFNLEYKNDKVLIKDGAWIALGATVLAGSVVEENAVLSAGAVHHGVLKANTLKTPNNIHEFKLND